MKQISIALIIAVLAVTMITGVSLSQTSVAQQVKEGKIQVKTNNLDIKIIGGEGKTGPAGKNGIDGKDGAPGPVGPRGAPGLNGTDGKNGTTLPEETINIINEVVALYKNGSLNVNICYFQDASSEGECPPTGGNTTVPVVDNQTEVIPPVVDNSTNTNSTDVDVVEPPVIVVDDNSTNIDNSTQPLPPVIPPNNTNTENNANGTQANTTGLFQ